MVYIIQQQNSNYFKVGYTSNAAESRLRQLQTGNPRKLVIYATINTNDDSLERRFHQALFAYRTDGGEEWFEIDPNTLDQLLGEYYASTRYVNQNDQVRGLYADHVRQIRGGQQDAIAPRGQDVLFARNKEAVNAQREREFVSERQELDIGGEADRGPGIQELGKRFTRICDD